MSPDHREVLERKLGMLQQFLADLAHYSHLDTPTRRREHYAIERLLQLLCESAADIGLQLLRADGYKLASSYREVFQVMRDRLGLPDDLADSLMDACAMRNVLTHLYDVIDLDRVVAAVEPAIDVYGRYAKWAQWKTDS